LVPFFADLHIHSRYSRACSRDCDTEHLAWWAGRKGITVVGTGDFTHPAWTEELRANLVPAEPGLFRLRPDLERSVHERLPAACRTPVRFLLSSEISTIYKRDGRTRKVHHLLYAPGFDEVAAITAALAKIGNLGSDGRPILGLDSRDLLEITLEAGGYLVPAHAWTPWFAVLGSQSGFDDVASCYGDLSSQIHAVETGLSSDPEMNWRVSSLDQYRLVSNSDAHSPPMLGREATVFGTDVGVDGDGLRGAGAGAGGAGAGAGGGGASGRAYGAEALFADGYFGLKRALETGDGFGGTVEFFPEEGKYHLDGHRACDVRTTPEETKAAGGVCPACGKKPTVGVQHRVDTLADRENGYRLEGAADFRSFVPLPEILGEIAGVGPKSKTVTAQVSAMVERFGPELSILGEVPLDDLAARAPSIVVEAISRLRRGDVRRDAGYDGVYGTISLFDPGELAGAALFDVPTVRKPRKAAAAPGTGAAVGAANPAASGASGSGASGSDGPSAGGPGDLSAGGLGLDPDQQAIVDHDGGPLLVVAGPGAGKTRVLVHSLARRLRDGADPEKCLAITFTRRARDELAERLAVSVPDAAGKVAVTTFHGLGLLILREQCKRIGLDAGLKVADEPARRGVLRQLAGTGSGGRPAPRSGVGGGARVSGGWTALAAKLSRAKHLLAIAAASGVAPGMDMETAALLAAYDARLRERGLVDVDDLITLPVLLLSAKQEKLAESYRSRWSDVYVDEYQDVDELQYRLLRLITSEGRSPVPPGCAPDQSAKISDARPADQQRIIAIGDPDQAIYGFRGGDVGYFLRFAEDYPDARRVELERNYRSAPSIVTSALQVIRPGTLVPGRTLTPSRTDIADSPVMLATCSDERAEAEVVARMIEKMLGGTSLLTTDGRQTVEHQLSFADFAVLYRTSSQAVAVTDALDRRGFPAQRRAHSRLAEMPGVAPVVAALRAPVLDADPVPVAALLTEAVESALASVADGTAVPDDTVVADDTVAADDSVAAEGTAVADGGTPVDNFGDNPVSNSAARGKTGATDRTGAVGTTAGEVRAEITAAAEVLAPLAARCGTDLDRFLDELSLGAEVDTWDPRADRVSLLTLHASKGLEFPVVFIVGCDDGLLPLRAWQGAETDYAEERRLLFVGMTRATTKLVLLTAGRRTVFGQTRDSSPSPFLSSIDPALLDRTDGNDVGRGGARGSAGSGGKKRARRREEQPTLF
jgi:superfamily I DNA/RNA helicase/PHP family Zn ribbon phosphoesterase